MGLRDDGPPRRAGDFLRIAHRGASGECPENTLAAFRRAIDAGVDMIECDLQLTADGHVIVMHDWTLERTTNAGGGLVSELTLEELKRCDAGAWFGPRFAGEQIPTIEETLEVVLPRAQMNLELKCRGSAEQARWLSLSTLAAVSRFDGLDRVIFSSFDESTLRAVRRTSPYAQLGVLWDDAPLARAWPLASELAAVAFHPNARRLDASVIDLAHENGLLVYTWTVNEVERVVELVCDGVDGVFSDFPGRLLEARARTLRAARR